MSKIEKAMSTLDRAILIAAQAHHGQKDRYGQPYILHPLRMMMKMESEIAKIVAVLHDVVEKSEWTLEDLKREGFSEQTVDAVDRLTKRNGEPYAMHLERARTSQLARKVKIADLEDNLDPERGINPSRENEKRLVRLKKAWSELKKGR